LNKATLIYFLSGKKNEKAGFYKMYWAIPVETDIYKFCFAFFS